MQNNYQKQSDWLRKCAGLTAERSLCFGTSLKKGAGPGTPLLRRRINRPARSRDVRWRQGWTIGGPGVTRRGLTFRGCFRAPRLGNLRGCSRTPVDAALHASRCTSPFRHSSLIDRIDAWLTLGPEVYSKWFLTSDSLILLTLYHLDVEASLFTRGGRTNVTLVWMWKMSFRSELWCEGPRSEDGSRAAAGVGTTKHMIGKVIWGVSGAFEASI